MMRKTHYILNGRIFVTISLLSFLSLLFVCVLDGDVGHVFEEEVPPLIKVMMLFKRLSHATKSADIT